MPLTVRLTLPSRQALDDVVALTARTYGWVLSEALIAAAPRAAIDPDAFYRDLQPHLPAPPRDAEVRMTVSLTAEAETIGDLLETHVRIRLGTAVSRAALVRAVWATVVEAGTADLAQALGIVRPAPIRDQGALQVAV